MTNTKSITHTASGATCNIHDFGACLLSYKTGGSAPGREVIFVSRDTKLDGTKAIRGGIPLVFPQFGQPDSDMPQHGFLRMNYWKTDESSLFDDKDEAGITYRLDLDDVVNSRGTGKWDKTKTGYNCTCLYHVKIGSDSFSTELQIKNTGDQEFPFQTLLHTYYNVDGNEALDGSKCYVKGLEGYTCKDKVSNDEYILGKDPIVLDDGLTDRVYSPPPDGGKDTVDVTVGVGQGRTIRVTASGTVGTKTANVSCVVWNPHKEKAMGMSDFGNDQYTDMICVEPGILDNEMLKPGETASLMQTTQVL